MKILYFHQHFSTPKGSVGIRSYAMSRKLIEAGHSVTMVCGSYRGGETGLNSNFLKGKREGYVDEVYIIEFDLSYANSDSYFKRSSTFVKFAFWGIREALTQKYDILFATSTPLTAGIPGIFARWLRKKTFVFEVRDLWPELPREMGVIKNRLVLFMLTVLERATYRSAHKIVGLSPGIVEGVIKCGIRRENVAMIPNGCDISIFSKKLKLWRPSNILPSDLMVIYSGTHGLANGLDAVLDAASVLKKRGRIDIKIVLIGQGKLKPALESRAKLEDLSDVIFFQPVDKDTLAGLLAGADLGLQILANVPAFYHGTSPNKFFDYIAAGLPVLNNYPGWLAYLIEEHQCGIVVAPDDSEDFASALERAADSRAELKRMGSNAYDLAITQFNRDKLSGQFVEWLTKATNEI